MDHIWAKWVHDPHLQGFSMLTNHLAAYPLTSRCAHMCVEWRHHPCLLGVPRCSECGQNWKALVNPCHRQGPHIVKVGRTLPSRGSPMLVTATKSELVTEPLPCSKPGVGGMATSPLSSWRFPVLKTGTKSEMVTQQLAPRGPHVGGMATSPCVLGPQCPSRGQN